MSFENYFNNVAFFQELNFDLTNNDDRNKLVDTLGVGENSITTYCKGCDYEYSFSHAHYLFTEGYSTNEVSLFKYQYTQGNGYVVDKHFSLNLQTGFKIISGYEHLVYEPSRYSKINKSEALVHHMVCDKNPEHSCIVYSLLNIIKNKVTLIKVGQYPSPEDSTNYDFDKYKSILRRFGAYIDFKRAELSKMRNYYVGAYAYMRRILEKMVVYFTEKLKTIDDKYVIPSEAEQKIKDVKHYFKPEIQEIIYPFYQVLSKGIHELSDDECEEHYESIHALMLKQLEYMLSIEVDKKQNKELNGVFKKLVEKYGKNK